VLQGVGNVGEALRIRPGEFALQLIIRNIFESQRLISIQTLFPKREPAETSPGYSALDWQLRMGDFVGCIDEVRISKGIR